MNDAHISVRKQAAQMWAELLAELLEGGARAGEDQLR